jgi:hypothetical protein
MGCIQGCDKGAGWASIGYRVVGVDRGPGFTGALVPQIDPKGIRKESERNPKGIRKESERRIRFQRDRMRVSATGAWRLSCCWRW